MTDHHADGHALPAGAQTEHVVPVSVYAAVYVALMLLLGLTVGVYYIHTPWNIANNAIAMTIGCVKAVLVVLFFMGVRYSTRLTWVWAAAGFGWLVILFTTLGDYFMRMWLPVHGW